MKNKLPVGVHVKSTSKCGRKRQCVRIAEVNGKRESTTFHQIRIGGKWLASSIDWGNKRLKEKKANADTLEESTV